MTHVVVTRLLYKEEKDFKERLDLYKETALDCLKKQTVRNFDIAIHCNPDHAEYVRELDFIPFFMKDRSLGYRQGPYWTAYTSWSNIEGLEKYDIQTNLDSDDIITNDYIVKIQEIMKGDESIHLHFQPKLRNHHTKEVKESWIQYGSTKGSMFYSLYQPSKENYVFIGHDTHADMWKYVDKTIFINDKTYCWLNIHGKNDSSYWQKKGEKYNYN